MQLARFVYQPLHKEIFTCINKPGWHLPDPVSLLGPRDRLMISLQTCCQISQSQPLQLVQALENCFTRILGPWLDFKVL